MTNYPTTLDDATSLPVESASTALSVNHVTAHQNVQDAIEAIEAKVGVNSSAVTTSHDYKLSAVTGSDKALKSGTSTQSVTGLTLASPKITVGSDAVGDLHYVSNVDGTQSRLAKGNDNQILKMNGTAINWEDEITTVNASTTAAGIVELATTAQVTAGTATGETGAALVVTPDALLASGIVSNTFGSGVDGAYTFSNQGTAPTGTTKTDNTNNATIFRLDRDIYCTTITIDSTVVLNPNGYRLFATTSSTINGSIKSNGGNGGDAVTTTGGTAGTAAHGQGTLPASFAGIVGGAGGSGGGAQMNGGSSSGITALGSIGVSSSIGGSGGAASPASGGSSSIGTATPIRYPRTLVEALTLISGGVTLASMYMLSSPGAPGGGGGGNQGSGGPTASGGGGGGGGASGGMIFISSSTITVGAAGSIQANGGNGGNGANATGDNGVNAGGGGTGAGGSGGVIILIYANYTNSGSVTVSGGTKGSTVGTPKASGDSGTLGTDGVVGVYYQIPV